MININKILSQSKFQKISVEVKNYMINSDSSHNFSHCLRVLNNGIKIASIEGGDLQIITAAALLHDIYNLPKNNPKKHLSSQISANKAKIILKNIGFEKEKIEIIKDAIICHSFSLGLTPKSLEGKILQDADRLDAIGAIGIARAYATGAKFNSLLYSSKDPFLKTNRCPDDKNNTLDHFFIKLLKIKNRMLTLTGKKLAQKRTTFMMKFIKHLEKEIK
ncbi:HD domain-containing protein [Candidatus Babeliales bacterium]|nr:HD domain-containing protein [Candidatus Babeliales bacterium]